MWSFSTVDNNFTAADIQATVIGGQDLDGDLQQEFMLGDAFIIDTENPRVSGVDFANNINELLVGTNLNLLANFSEEMSDVSPVVSFVNEDPTINSLSLLLGQPEWINTSQFGVAYLINDADEELYNITVSVSGATDLVGNELVIEDLLLNTYIDTKAPLISNVSYSTNVANESNATVEGYSITVEADGEFLTSGDVPIISFPVEDPSSALMVNTGASGFMPVNQYEFVFDLADTDLELSNIDIFISEFRDAAGNIGESYSLVDAFSIDTKAPNLLEASFNTTVINDTETGNTLNINALFDEAMDETVEGEVVFNPQTPASLSSSLNSAWINTQLYRAVFDISDENEEEELMVRLESAKDLAGNTMNPWDSDEALILDNKNPDGFITANTYNVTNDNNGTSGFQVLVLFDEEVNSDVIPTLNFPVEDPSGSITVNTENSGWLGSAYRFDFDVSSDLTPLAYIDIDVSNAEDLYGNSMSEMNLLDYFSIQLDTFLVVNELSFEELRVYPNPVFKGENFTIELKDIENYAFVMYDQLGRIIESDKMSITGDKLIVSTSGLSSGKYFVKLQGENAQTVLRIEVLN